MKVLAGVTVLSLAIPMMGQVIAPPPAVPNVAPARPQPGIPTGASGGVGTPATGRLAPGNASGVTVTGRLAGAPPPVYMTPDQLQPPYFDPLIVPELFPLDPYWDLPREPIVGQGRPGGLGVTITGGSTNPPPITPTPAPNATSAVTNVAPVVTNLPPTNATNGKYY